MKVRATAFALVLASACSTTSRAPESPAPSSSGAQSRVGLKAGLHDAAEAKWNLNVLSRTRAQGAFERGINSDLAFSGNYAIQGNFLGFQVWDISNPRQPKLATSFVCPASQSDVSVYKNLLFVSGEGLEGRLDCGTQGVQDTVSRERLRGLRIFDISDIRNPRNVGNVQTCRGSHTHTVLEHPGDPNNVYVYISGSSPARSPNELPGCVGLPTDTSTALFHIEVIKVPLSNPAAAAIVSSPRIFKDLPVPRSHGEGQEEIAAAKKAAEEARARGAFTVVYNGTEIPLPDQFVAMQLDSVVRARGGSGAPTRQDSVAFRGAAQSIVDKMFPSGGHVTQCHDITVFPALGLAGGACEGFGLLLDIRDPVNPVRIAEVADSNFAYWHSATLNNDGTRILFTDEWGGGGSPKCRASDKKEWGANAIFSVAGGKMRFESYYKLPAPQTAQENCVAHNGSLIPIPDRDIMVQSWYQGGISIFEWTDPGKPVEIAYFDRGPADATRPGLGGSWSAYWYNGAIFSSEISRGLDAFELTPSEFISQNEIDAAKTIRMEYFNAQGQPRFVWPPSFALARAYTDQLERQKCVGDARIRSIRQTLAGAEAAQGSARRDALVALASQVEGESASSCRAKLGKLAATARQLGGIQP